MEKFNAIKILEEEQENQKLMNSNLGKEHYMASVYKFVDDYIKPMLQKLNSEGKITYCYEDNFEKFCLSKQLENLATHIANELGFINTYDEEASILNETEIGFLSKDKKIKKQVATKICEYLTRRLNYEKNLNDYVENYIVPLFKELNELKKITFDLNSTDEEILLISNNLIELAKRGTCENSCMSMAFPFTKDRYDNETLKHLNFLYSDDIEPKIEFANFLCSSFANNYDELDLKNTQKFNFKEEILKDY